ncbi:hypothetical protein ACPXB3_15430 [Gordonia sp. DT219]|uniref:hypothetical protein n=1 Tax=Gordonia sp. DT219 TaxID=3416658 RepID=UPI003CE6D900
MAFRRRLRQAADDAAQDDSPREWGAKDSPEKLADVMARDFTSAALPVDVDGYLYGPVAQGLAMSGPMVAANSGRWNSLTDIGDLAPGNVKYILNDVWGIEDAEVWMDRLNRLVSSRYGDSVAYHAADIRRAARATRDVPTLDDASWERALRDEAARLEASTEYADVLVASIPGIRAAEGDAPPRPPSGARRGGRSTRRLRLCARREPGALGGSSKAGVTSTSCATSRSRRGTPRSSLIRLGALTDWV